TTTAARKTRDDHSKAAAECEKGEQRKEQLERFVRHHVERTDGGVRGLVRRFATRPVYGKTRVITSVNVTGECHGRHGTMEA
ncbi:MAG: hypothetical protein RI908_409, partial [Actinomycetota bacterium]